MNKSVLLAAAKMLRLASEEFSNHGCNNIAHDFYSGGGIKPKKILAVCRRHKEATDEDTADTLGDYNVMTALAKELELYAKE